LLKTCNGYLGLDIIEIAFIPLSIKTLNGFSQKTTPINLAEKLKKLYLYLNFYIMKTKILIIILAIGILKSINAQIVNIPDTIFKAILIANSNINTNGDDEIQVSEAEAYTGDVNVNYSNIYDLTGIEAFINITSLYCSSNHLTNIDVSNNIELNGLYFKYNHLTSIDVSNNVNLKYLYCDFNQLTNIDVSNNPALITFELSNNPIASLDVSNNLLLRILNFEHTHITNIDVSNNTELLRFNCGNTEMASVDLSNNVNLESIYCKKTQITSLDLSANTALQQLILDSNQFTNLDLSANHNLLYLYCDYNLLTYLDLSSNPNILEFFCSNNELTGINLKNGNNAELDFFRVDYNLNLDCIQVDDSVYSSDHWWNFINNEQYYSENCNYETVENINAKPIFELYPNPAKNNVQLVMSNAQLSKNTNVFIYDVFGHEVGRTFLLDNKATINVEHLPRGVYFVRIGSVTKTFVKM